MNILLITCTELDQSIGDIHSTIVDIEVEIVLGLQMSIAEIQEPLIAYAEACFELDWYEIDKWSHQFTLVCCPWPSSARSTD